MQEKYVKLIKYIKTCVSSIDNKKLAEQWIEKNGLYDPWYLSVVEGGPWEDLHDFTEKVRVKEFKRDLYNSLVVQAIKLSCLVPPDGVSEFLDAYLNRTDFKELMQDGMDMNRPMVDIMVGIIKSCHQINGTPQGKQSLKHFLKQYNPASILFHGTNSAYLPFIRENGLIGGG